jgi:hypothetical protein
LRSRPQYSGITPGRIPQHEGEDAVERARQILRAHPLIQRQDDLAVRAGLQRIVGGKLALQRDMVVDLAVDRQYRAAVGADQRLGATGRIDDGQALVRQDHARVLVDAAPVRPAMALPPRAPQRLVAQFRIRPGNIENAEDRTHAEPPMENQPSAPDYSAPQR